jgi:FMN phosphatase YigB (HAD superfamily)/DNA-binding XRE family transcriptional regulator
MAMDDGGRVSSEIELGKRLQNARKAAGLTQQDLCQKANLSYSTLAKIERGAIKTPSIFTIQRIAWALDKTLDELVGSPAPSAQPPRELWHSKSGATFIYFDVNGCLVRGYHRAFGKISESCGRPIDVVETVFWHYNDIVCRGQMNVDDFNRTFAEELGLTSVDWQSYYLEATESVPEISDLVSWAAQHYRVGLFTNIMPGFLASLKAKAMLPDVNFDAVIDSSEVGTIKPEDRIYEIGQERAGVPGGEILLVDDTRENLSAGQKHGWRTLWFDGYDSSASIAKLRDALQPGTA